MCPQKLGRSISMAKRQFRYRKPICPFISSTFQDFQAERDILVKKVFPAIDALCRQRGTYCAPVDLRWGINDAQVNSGAVIRLCLDYVTRSAPFFVCLLGERYGSHRAADSKPLPSTYEELDTDANWLDKNFLVAASGGYDWVLQETYQHRSVTELEIIQSLLNGAEHGYFYFRQPDHVDYLYTDLPEEERQEKLKDFESESEYSKLKVRSMKARIVKKGLPVKYFKTPDELVQIVLKDWKAVVDYLFPPLENMVGDMYSERFAEWMAHETYAETRRRAFVKSSEIEVMFQEMTEFAEKVLEPCENDSDLIGDQNLFSLRGTSERRNASVIDDPAVLVLFGDRGCGKTALSANWVREFMDDHPDVFVFTHYLGSSALSADVGAMMRGCVQDIRREYQYKGAENEVGASKGVSDFLHVCAAFTAAISQGPCILLIDGIDELVGSCGLSPQQIKEITWLPQPLPPQCRVILTTAHSDLTFKVLCQRKDTKTLMVPRLSDPASRREVIEEYLAMHCKCLNNEQLDRIVSCKLSDRPLFLTVLSNELRVFGVNSKLDYHLDSYLEAFSIRDLWSRIIQRWIKDYSWTAQPLTGTEEEGKGKSLTGWVADALRLISVSRNGLSQSEILKILAQLGYQGDRQVTSFDWAQFRSAALDALFERPGGLLSFFHHHLKEAVEYTLLGAVTPCHSREIKPKNGVSLTPKGAALMSSLFPTPLVETPRTEPARKVFHAHVASFFMNCCHCERRNDELPWQLEMCHNTDKLCEVLSEPRLFLDLHEKNYHSRHLDLFHYWKVLKSEGLHAGITYTNMVDEICTRVSHDHLPSKESGDEHVNDEEGSDNLSQSSDDQHQLSLNIRSVRCLTIHQVALLCRVVGVFLSELGYFEQAERMLLMAQEKLIENYPLADDAQQLLCEVEESLANLYFYQLKKTDATRWYNKALQSVERLLEGLDHEDGQQVGMETRGRLLDKLGNMNTFERNYGKAEKLLAEAQRCMSRAGSETGRASVQHHTGILQMNKGQFVGAELCFRQAVTARERWYGRWHHLVAEVLNDLAQLLCHPQNNISYDRYEAEALYRRALMIREQSFGPDHLLVATTLFHLGKLLQTVNSNQSRSETLNLLRRSLDIRTTNLGCDHYITKAVRRVLSNVETWVKSSRQTNTSNVNGCYSALSWHDTDLLIFQQRARAKAAEVARDRSMSQQPANQTLCPVKRVTVQAVRQSSGRHARLERDTITEDGTSTLNSHVESFVQDIPIRKCQSRDPECENKPENSCHENVDHRESVEVLPQRKPRPRSSYGRRMTPVAIQQLTESHSALSNKQESGDPCYTSNPLPLMQGSQPVQTKIVLKLRRSKTDPRKLPGTENLVITPVPSVFYKMHQQHCYIPGPHTVDVHNSYSPMVGPNNSLYSLMGAPRPPRDVFLGVQHTSAWYHVPGRYPTVQKPYAAKRSQQRVESRSQLDRSASYSWATDKLDEMGADGQYSEHSWDSRPSIPIGTVGGRVDNWNI